MRLDIAEEQLTQKRRKKAYLRRAFLAGSSINNPRTSSYHMEFSLTMKNIIKINGTLNSF